MAKLSRVGSQSALENLIGRVRECGEELTDEQVTRASLSKAMLSGREFIWEQLVVLLFK